LLNEWNSAYDETTWQSAITNWAKSLPIQVVQKLAGHSDISTTRKYYLAVRNENMEQARKYITSILTAYNCD
jgi:integrase